MLVPKTEESMPDPMLVWMRGSILGLMLDPTRVSMPVRMEANQPA
jgi:hypothetical protein